VGEKPTFMFINCYLIDNLLRAEYLFVQAEKLEANTYPCTIAWPTRDTNYLIEMPELKQGLYKLKRDMEGVKCLLDSQA